MGAAFSTAEEVENAAVFPLPKVRLGAALRSLFSEAHKESMGATIKRKRAACCCPRHDPATVTDLRPAERGNSASFPKHDVQHRDVRGVYKHGLCFYGT